MPIAMHHESDHTYRLEISGVLLRAEFRQCEAELTSELDRVGSARLLFVLTAFEGWERHADWNDLAFYVKHGDAIERIAIVGDERWRSEALMFAGADLRRAPVEYFEGSSSDDGAARAWLTA